MLCTLEEQLPLVSYQRILASFRPSAGGPGALAGRDEQLAFMVLAGAAKLLGGFSFGSFLEMADEIEEGHGAARVA
ncbi:hypothetical protein ACFVGY_34950 [Streptomyces sp. NPDC127106]|uniref:hypothetical protein n=1 Tax=Streptomyces sp. NPDC127106 TaxID=3345360 RepID=UPI003631D179